jgi:ketosteroid isomerase-like protein
MRSSDSRAQVIAFFAAFYAGDVQRTLACCDDDIRSMVYLPVELFPHLAPRRGKQAVAALVELHVARYSKRRHEVTFIAADRLRVAAILELSFTKRSDGRVMRFTTGNFFTLRRGLITEMQTFFDTLDMIEQLTGRDLVGPLLAEVGAALRPPALPPSPPAARIK